MMSDRGLRTLKKTAPLLVAVILVACGTTLAVAGNGGSTQHGNAGQDQYHEKPGCGPDKNGGYAGNSGYHSGQPPKSDDRGDCPDPPNCQNSHFSSFTGNDSSGKGNECDDCNDTSRRTSSGHSSSAGNKNGNDCRKSSEPAFRFSEATAA